MMRTTALLLPGIKKQAATAAKYNESSINILTRFGNSELFGLAHHQAIWTQHCAIINFMKGYMKDCINLKGEKYDYTCIQKRRERITLSTIGYIFAGHNTHKKMHDGDEKFFSAVYTDHALITITLTVEMINNGKGIWRANPHLAKNRIYTKKLTKEISNYVQHKLDPDSSAQVKWDLIKNMVKSDNKFLPPSQQMEGNN